jgi:hypothetical protein
MKMASPKAVEVTVTDDTLLVDLEDGRTISVVMTAYSVIRNQKSAMGKRPFPVVCWLVIGGKRPYLIRMV